MDVKLIDIELQRLEFELNRLRIAKEVLLQVRAKNEQEEKLKAKLLSPTKETQ